jgi:hypothetical protein
MSRAYAFKKSDKDCEPVGVEIPIETSPKAVSKSRDWDPVGVDMPKRNAFEVLEASARPMRGALAAEAIICVGNPAMITTLRNPMVLALAQRLL